MSIPLNTIYSYFETGDFPTQEQFQASWASFWHKDESIPTNKVAGLDSQLQNKADKNILETHISNPDSHTGYLAKKDASNLDNTNVQAWKTALGVGELPENLATVDNGGQFGNVYSKDQSNERFLTFNDYVNDDRKIRADKIEALGLTTLIEAKETTISGFAANAGSYQFEDNDFIAIPDSSGNFSLYMFKGNEKTEVKNYLATGLSNVTIGMVEGLQTALNSKMDKPSATGNFSYVASVKNGVVTWSPILMSPNYMVYWNGIEFMAANVAYQQGKVGIGIGSPSEQLHVIGRVQTDAVVLSMNTETRNNQLTYDGTKFYGTNVSNIKRPFMFSDYEGEVELWSNLTDTQKTNLKTIMNGGWSTGTMSAALISPPIVDQTKNQPSWITLKGANLNLNPTTFSVELLNIDTNIYTTIPGSQIQLFTTGLDLVFWFNFNTIPEGNYKIRLWNGVAYYTTPMTLKSLSKLVEFDMTSIVWTPLKADGSTTSGSYGNNGYGTITPGGVWTALRSSVLFKENEDFSLSFKINSQLPISNQVNYVGIVSGLIPLSTVNNFSIEWKYQDYASWGGSGNVLLNGNLAGTGSTNFTDTIYITRQGTLYSVMVVKGDGKVHYFNITTPAVPVTLGLLGIVGTETLTIQQIYSLNQ
ncbi:hypothetical protein C1637_18610 [Chryseobacterium lactis]|uniref:DUF2793 domain-containing protein n=1 Tax=Chryseobacterium lactis TaxID=1241981 RepID=A0A3G6RTA2_CHRLC|nr:hypothetical protein [Chryseobacterium lactis]AZA84795.1 hypothetical protein EG342_24120 [Chryseobacterium lactis]AZB05184.1 hypothetical protein EG341_15000 [Chryseobacterium lactis]PNW12166.1 hypothetical protein C1637_18610 [Chryseobacterium lactis]